VITSDKAFDLLVEACPSYWAADGLNQFVAAFEDADEPDLFVRVSAFAHHLIEIMVTGDDHEVRAVFAVVEQLLGLGDDETVELVELGLIESVQNIVSHQDVVVGPDRFVPLLGPMAAEVWAEHDELWREAGRWRHDGPRVGQAEYDGVASPNLRRYFQASKRRLADGVLIGASDIVRYQTELRDISPITPAGRPRIPWVAVIIGLVLAACVMLALHR
jgi:hypothetical protein